MARPRTIARLQTLIWVLIYGGLFGIVIGFATMREAPATGWALKVVGALVVATGVVLIFVRSRMTEDPE